MAIYLYVVCAIDSFSHYWYWLHFYLEFRFAGTFLARSDDDSTKGSLLIKKILYFNKVQIYPTIFK